VAFDGTKDFWKGVRLPTSLEETIKKNLYEFATFFADLSLVVRVYKIMGVGGWAESVPSVMYVLMLGF
jgi:hypothetical protein